MQFLTEVDVGDLQLAQQQRQKEEIDSENARSQDLFKKEQRSAFPSKGDVIVTKQGNYIFAGADRENVYIQKAGQKPQSFPQGAFGFKATGQQSKAGKPIYNIIKK